MYALTAVLNGPGGAWISGTKGDPDQPWSVIWGINASFSTETEGADADKIVAKLDADLARLNQAREWIRKMQTFTEIRDKELDAKAIKPRFKIEQRVDTVEFDTVLTNSINKMTKAIMAAQPLPPQPFDKEGFLKSLQAAKEYAAAPRWMVAVDSIERFNSAFGDKLTHETGEGWLSITDPPRDNGLTGEYGSLLGIRVIVDPEIDGWELRDGVTGEKLPFVDNPDTGDRYYFNQRYLDFTQPGGCTVYGWPTRFMTGGEQNGETVAGSDRVGRQAEDAPGAG